MRTLSRLRSLWRNLTRRNQVERDLDDELRAMLLLMGAVILVLLIACVNVIALLLGRGVTRRHEIGLRLAIGATRTRVFRQMLTESLLLVAAGAAIGLAMATVGAPLLVRILSRSEVPLTLNVIPDARVVLFTALASVAAAVAAGAVPAMRTIRGASAAGLGGHTRTASLTRDSTRSGQSLREIVGVVASAKYYSLRDRETPTASSTISEGERGSLTLAVRTAGMPLLLAGELRRRVTAVAPDVPVSRVRTLANQLERSLGSERLVARLLGAFAILSLGLASLGLYGVLGYAVARRTSEIGVRLAPGATRLGVLRATLGQASMMVVAGSAIGIPAALLFSKPLGHLLYGVTPADPRVLAGSVACLFVVALAAAAAPAWRAARVDPVVALRYD